MFTDDHHGDAEKVDADLGIEQVRVQVRLARAIFT
jgi:hypothetical protein